MAGCYKVNSKARVRFRFCDAANHVATNNGVSEDGILKRKEKEERIAGGGRKGRKKERLKTITIKKKKNDRNKMDANEYISNEQNSRRGRRSAQS